MPDAIEQLRHATERDLAEAIGKLGPTHRRRIMDAIVVYGSARAIPAEVWESIRQDVDRQSAAILLLLLVGAYGEQQRTTAKTLGVAAPTIDSEGLKRAAAPSAARLGRQVADDYVGGIQNRLEKRIDGNADTLKTLPPKEQAKVVRDEIEAAVGEEPAKTAIVTNTTRATTASQGSAGDDLGRAANVTMTAVWVTEKDGKVCSICRPLDGKTVDRWEAVLDANVVGADARAAIVGQMGPPAHPNCRCRLSYVAAVESEN